MLLLSPRGNWNQIVFSQYLKLTYEWFQSPCFSDHRRLSIEGVRPQLWHGTTKVCNRLWCWPGAPILPVPQEDGHHTPFPWPAPTWKVLCLPSLPQLPSPACVDQRRGEDIKQWLDLGCRVFLLRFPLAVIAGQVSGLLQGVEPHLPQVWQGIGSLLSLCQLWGGDCPHPGLPGHPAAWPSLPLSPLQLVVQPSHYLACSTNYYGQLVLKNGGVVIIVLSP